MIISRAKAGWLMIGGSIFLFLLIAILPESQIALAGLINVGFLISIALMTIGIYFVRTSKPCSICDETVGLAETKCKYCGHTFRNG